MNNEFSEFPFVGRTKELTQLRTLLTKPSASLVVIRGRRRIGKSRLTEEFAKNLPFIKFEGIAPDGKTTAQMQREEFARQISQNFGLPGLKATDWGDLFTVLAKFLPKGRTILLLDEITWMGSLDPTFIGKFKIAWDNHFKKNQNLILILCGSISSWIEKNILSSTGFFGRISEKIFLQGLSLHESNLLLKKIHFQGSEQEKFLLLSVTGGVPWYIEQINPQLTAQENIRRLCFNPDGLLVDEFTRIFYDLFGRRSEIYRKIVEILKQGPIGYSDLAKSLPYPTGKAFTEYLNDLIISGFLRKEHTWSIKTGKASRKFRYRIRDNFLRFYLKCIEPNIDKIQRGVFVKESLFSLPGWESSMGLQFENLVLNNRDLLLEALGLRIGEIVYDNPFFQKKTDRLKGCQIDYLVQTRFGNLYVCEIKFSRNPISSSLIDEMKLKIQSLSIPRAHACLPVLVHINGVTPEVEESRFFAKIISFGDLLS